MSDVKLNLTPVISTGGATSIGGATQMTDVIIRNGEAAPIELKQPFSFTGEIGSCYKYIMHMQQKAKLDNSKAVAIVDYKNYSIILYEDRNEARADKIIGVFTINPELLEFGINTQKTYSPTTLVKFLRMKRMYFHDSMIFTEFLNRLQNFNITDTRVINQADNQRGDKTNLLQQTINNELPDQFVLNMPIFIGGAKYKFAVNIFFDERDKNIDLWFESVELKELMDSIYEDSLALEADKISQAGFLVLSK